MKKLFITIFILSIAVSANAGIVSKPVEYTQNGTVLEGYMAYDDSIQEKRPGVLVVHEWWGLTDYVRSRVNKLAQLGYVAFALDMYGKGIWTKDPAEAKNLSGHLMGTPLMLERANAGLEVLRSNSQVDTGRIAAIGYCFGGTTVLELAYSGANLAGVVTFHAGLIPAKEEDLSRIKTRFLICHGADDEFASFDDIIKFQDGLRKSGADWQMIFFGGAVHSFTNPSADEYGIEGIAYNKNADIRSWQYMKFFFEEIF